MVSEALYIYVLSLGIFLIVLGVVEIIAPLKVFEIWTKWVSRKEFFMHGLILIVGGFPLTVYNGALSGLIFFMGLVPVLIGPFILFYPEKVKNVFLEMSSEMSSDSEKSSIKKIILFDAGIRISIGVVFTISFALSKGLI
ncbi:MAG: hypothetical protein MUD12_01385 [Spirochaetes bacterium]|jgi:hypothetical protein|nr:hypothetical protein [Spirochaetota bacterium]